MRKGQPGEAQLLWRVAAGELGVGGAAIEGCGESTTAAELVEAKNGILTAALKGRETAEGKASTLAVSVIIDGDPRTADRQLAAIAQVTAADLQRVARKYLRDERSAAIQYLPAESAPAGMMTAVGIHMTDLFIKLAGPAMEVRARSARLIFQPPAEDFVNANILFRSGAIGAFTALSITPFYARFTIYGDAGWVEVMSEANVDQGKPTTLTHVDHKGRRSVVYEATDTVTQNFEAWADAVEGKAPYRFTDDELSENIRVFEAIVKSTRKNGAAETLV